MLMVCNSTRQMCFPLGQAEWKTIWSLSIPNKVCNFVCRACKNSIPIKTNLVRRKVLSEDIYNHCHDLSCEDTMHALWNCPCLSLVWDFDSMWNFRRNLVFNRFGDLVKFIIDRGKNLEIFAVIVWTI